MKKHSYNIRLLKEDYSYYVEQIADLFTVEVATVRRWIQKEGLRRIPHTRPHIIHSSELKTFLEKKRAKRKRPCAAGEVFCLPCQSPRLPATGSGSITICANGSYRFRAICSQCRRVIYRNIRAVEWTLNHPLAGFLSEAMDEHKGVYSMHPECSLQ